MFVRSAVESIASVKERTAWLPRHCVIGSTICKIYAVVAEYSVAGKIYAVVAEYSVAGSPDRQGDHMPHATDCSWRKSVVDQIVSNQ
jgi:hypothetical protein